MNYLQATDPPLSELFALYHSSVFTSSIPTRCKIFRKCANSGNSSTYFATPLTVALTNQSGYQLLSSSTIEASRVSTTDNNPRISVRSLSYLSVLPAWPWAIQASTLCMRAASRGMTGRSLEGYAIDSTGTKGRLIIPGKNMSTRHFFGESGGTGERVYQSTRYVVSGFFSGRAREKPESDDTRSSFISSALWELVRTRMSTSWRHSEVDFQLWVKHTDIGDPLIAPFTASRTSYETATQARHLESFDRR